MKKFIVTALALIFIASIFTSCRSSKPSCAAYDYIELEESK